MVHCYLLCTYWIVLCYLFCSQILSPWLGDIVDYDIGLSYRPIGYIGRGGAIRQPYAVVDCSPLSGTKNLASVVVVCVLVATGHRVHTEWPLSLSWVHSITMEKLAQPGVGGGCMPCTLPFTISTITYKVVVLYWWTPQLRGQIHYLFLLYPYMYSVVLSVQS